MSLRDLIHDTASTSAAALAGTAAWPGPTPTNSLADSIDSADLKWAIILPVSVFLLGLLVAALMHYIRRRNAARHATLPGLNPTGAMGADGTALLAPEDFSKAARLTMVPKDMRKLKLLVYEGGGSFSEVSEDGVKSPSAITTPIKAAAIDRPQEKKLDHADTIVTISD
ncbi:hypothetical protein HK101_001093, partial [Irineochytrium annulatum]